MKIFLKICVLVLFAISYGKFFYITRDSFNFQKICYVDPEKTYKKEAFSDQAIFSQKFSYMGKGRQSYAFLSEDEKYVLKFPRLHLYKTPFWLKNIPFSKAYKNKFREEKRGRLTRLLDSFEMAKTELGQDTGVIYVHLNKTNHLNKKIIIKDPLGVNYFLDLDQTIFVLQKKIPLMIPSLKKAISQNNDKEARKILAAFVDLIAKRSQKGIFNKDGSFLRNYGYEGSESFHIDVGSFYKPQEIMAPQISFQQTMQPVKEWLEILNLDLYHWLEDYAEITSKNAF